MTLTAMQKFDRGLQLVALACVIVALVLTGWIILLSI